ncbi:MAG: NTPase [Actinomycetota bacterium]|nr:NTPase [Actinomycetota bacterium]
MPNNVLITGRPGSGKTTLVVRLVERLSREGFKVAGFITEEIREGGKRKGFKVRDLRGESAVLAHMDFRGRVKAGKYGVDIKVFEEVVSRALCEEKKEADILVIDEIGRMELASSLFRSEILELIGSEISLLATVHKVRDSFTAPLLARDDISVYDTECSARDSLQEVIYENLLGMIVDGNMAVECEGGKRS